MYINPRSVPIDTNAFQEGFNTGQVCQSYQNLTILEKYFQGYNVGKTNKTKRKTQAFLPVVAFVKGNTGCPAHLSEQTHIGRKVAQCNS